MRNSRVICFLRKYSRWLSHTMTMIFYVRRFLPLSNYKTKGRLKIECCGTRKRMLYVHYYLDTVLKFKDFSTTQILREFNYFSKMSNTVKMATHHTFNSLELISRKKSKWQKNYQVFTLCMKDNLLVDQLSWSMPRD